MATEIDDLKARLATLEKQLQQFLNPQALVVQDPKSKARVKIEAGDGEAAVLLFDKNGKQRLSLAVNDAREPSVILYNGAEAPRLALGVSANGARAQLNDAGEKPRLALFVDRGGPEIDFINAQGEVETKLPADD